jgi:dienelactone hydrolase
MEQYKNIVFKIIKQDLDSLCDLFLVGFSVGASALWALSGEIYMQRKIKAICFYGSQIRHYSEINPIIEIELFFPEHEPHFNVAKLISKLSHKKNVQCHMVPYLHGFMNKKSDNFNKTGYHNYLKILKNI